MSYGYPQAQGYDALSQAAIDARAKFIVRTYNHLFISLIAFAAIEFGLFLSGAAEVLARAMLGTSWLLVMGAFLIVSWLASHVAHRSESLPMQYLALAGFVVAEAIVFVPLLYIADAYAPGSIQSAALVSFLGFAGLTGIAFWTRKDFSFLGGVLRWGAVVALIAIVAGVVFSFDLGTFFSVAMVAFAGGAILYDTSNVLRSFPEDRYVAAALQLFASVALLFWYVLRIFLGARR